MIIRNAAGRAQFRPDKMGKCDLVSGDQLFVGLNCFEPGQEHAAHLHPGQDKLYLILEGSGDFVVGSERATLWPGDLAFAPAGVSHSVRNSGQNRLVVLVGFAPPPAGK
jgi:mannose-6-phosphate isomerase-like protein (cupin superfamily)